METIKEPIQVIIRVREGMVNCPCVDIVSSGDMKSTEVKSGSER